jgi:two-component system response regulator YesN
VPEAPPPRPEAFSVSPTFANFLTQTLTARSVTSWKNIGMNQGATVNNQESPIRILVVDDHPSTARTLARAISQLGDGIKVISAINGKQALEYANDQAVDLLITDMMMPEMSGLELIEHLQARHAGRPLHTILITAFDVPELRETAEQLRVHEIIIKPVSPERICRSVSSIVTQVKESWKAAQA